MAELFPRIDPSNMGGIGHQQDLATTVLKLSKRLEEFERLSPEHQDVQLSERLRRLLAYAQNYAPFWSERLRFLKRRKSTVMEVLERIPPLSRQELQSRQKELIADSPMRKNMRVTRLSTSGSTGTPVWVEVFPDIQMPIQFATRLLETRWHGIDTKKPLGVLLSKVRDDHRRRLGPPFEWYGPTAIGFARCTLDREHSELYDYCVRKKPVYLLCGPEPLVGMACYAVTSGRRELCPEMALTLGSTVTREMRDIVFEGLGTRIVDRYSAEEIGMIAVQCPRHDHYHVINSKVLVEIVDEENQPCPIGQPGRVLVTNLLSHAMPLIRYEIGDIAEWGGGCDCGISMPVIKKIWGRTSHIFTNPDGRKTYAKIYARAFDHLPDLLEYRFVLHQKSVIDAQLRVRNPSSALAASVIEKVHEAIGYPYKVKIRYVDEIDWGASWKKENFDVTDKPFIEGR